LSVGGGHTQDTEIFKAGLSGILSSVTDEKAAVTLAGSLPLLQLETWGGDSDGYSFTATHHTTLSLLESLAPPLLLKLIDIQGLFHSSEEIRRLSSNSLWSNIYEEVGSAEGSRIADPAREIIENAWAGEVRERREFSALRTATPWY